MAQGTPVSLRDPPAPLDPAAAKRLRVRAIYAALVVAALLIIAKATAWISTGSVALLSSLIDSLVDALASLVTFFAVRHAATPADREHRFGHGKAEPLAALGQSAFLIGSALLLMAEATRRLVTPVPVENAPVGIAVMLFSMAVTIGLVTYQRHVVRLTGSLAINADELHYRGDILMNLSVIATLVIAAFWAVPILDPLFGGGVGLWIIYNAGKIARLSLTQLMDRELPDEERARVRAIAESHPEVIAVHDIPAAIFCRFRARRTYRIEFWRDRTADDRSPRARVRCARPQVLADVRAIFRTEHPVVIYPASGTGAWEAALVNTLSPWRPGADVRNRPLRELGSRDGDATRARYRGDPDGLAHGASRRRSRRGSRPTREHGIRRSASYTTRPRPASSAASRSPARDRRGPPPGLADRRYDLLARLDRLPDGRMGRRCDGRGSQKGLMLPPGNRLQRGIGQSACRAASATGSPPCVLELGRCLRERRPDSFRYTPATNLLYGLKEAIAMLLERRGSNVFARHSRHGEATRRAVRPGDSKCCARTGRIQRLADRRADARGSERRPAARDILDASTCRSAPASASSRARCFGIGHLGYFNDLMLSGTRAHPYSRDEVLAAVSLHPTIEIVDSRYQDFRSLDRLQVLADNFSNGALVYGAAASGWQDMDLAHPPIAVTADAKDFAECTGLRAGDPITLLVDLVNHVANRRGGVPAGTFVTTGTHTGMVFTDPGVQIAADYGPLGRVEVSFPREAG
jgi:ferrous-iron efflux pump FieF